MMTMQLALNIDAQKFIQNVQINNVQLEKEVQAGLDKAIEELSKEGVIQDMITDCVKKNIVDSVRLWVMRYDVQKMIAEQMTTKIGEKIKSFTDTVIDELGDKLGLEKI